MSERTLLPKSDFAAAVNYIRNHWEPLQLYTTNGLIPINNNDVEQLMKQVATGREIPVVHDGQLTLELGCLHCWTQLHGIISFFRDETNAPNKARDRQNPR